MSHQCVVELYDNVHIMLNTFNLTLRAVRNNVNPPVIEK